MGTLRSTIGIEVEVVADGGLDLAGDARFIPLNVAEDHVAAVDVGSDVREAEPLKGPFERGHRDLALAADVDAAQERHVDHPASVPLERPSGIDSWMAGCLMGSKVGRRFPRPEPQCESVGVRDRCCGRPRLRNVTLVGLCPRAALPCIRECGEQLALLFGGRRVPTDNTSDDLTAREGRNNGKAHRLVDHPPDDTERHRGRQLGLQRRRHRRLRGHPTTPRRSDSHGYDRAALPAGDALRR